MENEIKKGMTVQFTSGGVAMDVISPIVEAVCCQWIDQSGIHTNYFPVKLLKILDIFETSEKNG